MKLAPLQSDAFESKNSQKITLGKSSTETFPIPFSNNTAPVLNFTNSNIGNTAATFVPL